MKPRGSRWPELKILIDVVVRNEAVHKTTNSAATVLGMRVARFGVYVNRR
jgi:hypothetical protein